MTPSIAIQDDIREMTMQCSEMLNDMRWGMTGWLERLDEQKGNYGGSSLDGAGRSKGSHSDPTEARAGKADPGQAEYNDALKATRKAYKAVREAYAYWDRTRAPRRDTTEKLSDPGCEPCTSIPAELPNGQPGYPMHFCPTHTSPDIVEKTISKKGKIIETTREKFRMCSSCYTFWRRNERVPTVYEVVDHVEGRRRQRRSA